MNAMTCRHNKIIVIIKSKFFERELISKEETWNLIEMDIGSKYEI